MSRSRDIAKFAGSASVFVYPTTDGSDGQTLTTDGAGNLLLEAASGGGAGVTSYTNASDLPLSGNTAGDLAYVNETARLYVNNGTGWYNVSLVNTNPSITSVQDADSNTTPFTFATDGTAVVITITAADPEEVPLTYSYSVTSGSLTNGGGATATVSQGTGANTNVFTITPTTTQAYAGSFTLTFTASDGINQATSANVFSLQFTIPNSKYTTLLLQADASSSDNQVDASSNSLTITESGNVTSTAFTPYHPKGYSTYLDGTGDYLEVPDDDGFELSGDFAIELWFNRTSVVGGTYSTLIGGNGSGSNGWTIYITNSNGAISFYHNSFLLTYTEGVVSNTWYHVAVTRSGTALKLFVNGVERASTTNSDTFNQNTANTGTRIGYDIGANGYFNGYIQDVRVVNGSAVYTSAFTPPTERLTAITNTELLTCHLPYIKDGSSNDLSISVNGNTKTELFSPYDQSASYSKSSQGGSVYFDGASDYLSSTTSSAMDFGTGDFTIEFWMYPDNYTNGDVIADARAVWNDTGWNLEFKNNGIVFYSSGGDRLTSANLTTSAKQWTHVAFVRNSGTLNSFVNGVKDTGLVYSSNVNTTASTVRIGQRQDNGGGQYHGNLADFRIVSSAVYTADFTPPTEPLTAITNTELLTCTNKHEYWDAASGSLLTPYGTPEASTTQYKWGNSLYLNSEDISFPNNGRFDFNNTEDFTVEFWSYIPTFSGTYNAIASTYANGSAGWSIQTGSSGQVYINFSGDGTDLSAGAGSVSTSTWHHWALVGNSGTWTIYIDGTSVASSSSITHGSAGTDLHLGSLSSSYNFLTQYIEDFRFTRGLARYTSNFTTPSAAFQG